MGAFAYLVWTTGRNRLWWQMRRLRNLRYAIALVAGLVYVWWFLVRPAGGPEVSHILLGPPSEMLVTVFVLLTAMGTWTFGGDKRALAFTEAEVSLLFPAPLSRTALVGYRLARSQFTVIVNTLIWVVLLRRGGTLLPLPLRAISIWLLFSTLNLHRLAAALVRASWREHGRAAARRHLGSSLVFVAASLAVAVALLLGYSRLSAAATPGAFISTFAALLTTPPANVALYPFHLVVAPTFAHSAAEWSAAILPALLVLALHVWWVLRTDVAFEEAAIEASAQRAQRLDALRSTRATVIKSPPARQHMLPLASRGYPAMAIVWKNFICLRRTSQIRYFVAPALAAAFVGLMLSGGDDIGGIVANCALAIAATLLVFGTRIIRNDLRHDMLHLPVLKSLPLRGSDVVLTEVMSAAVPLAAAQVILMIVAYLALLTSPSPPLERSVMSVLLALSPIVLLVLNLVFVTIHNGTAVLFPAWTRLGTLVGGGVEALGQNVLVLAVTLAVLAISLVIPGGTAYGVLLWVHSTDAGIAMAVMIGSALLALETAAAIRALGGAFERVEPREAI